MQKEISILSSPFHSVQCHLKPISIWDGNDVGDGDGDEDHDNDDDGDSNDDDDNDDDDNDDREAVHQFYIAKLPINCPCGYHVNAWPRWWWLVIVLMMIVEKVHAGSQCPASAAGNCEEAQCLGGLFLFRSPLQQTKQCNAKWNKAKQCEPQRSESL